MVELWLKILQTERLQESYVAVHTTCLPTPVFHITSLLNFHVWTPAVVANRFPENKIDIEQNVIQKIKAPNS